MDDPFRHLSDDQLIEATLTKIPAAATETLPPQEVQTGGSIRGITEMLRAIKERGLVQQAIERGIPSQLFEALPDRQAGD